MGRPGRAANQILRRVCDVADHVLHLPYRGIVDRLFGVVHRVDHRLVRRVLCLRDDMLGRVLYRVFGLFHQALRVELLLERGERLAQHGPCLLDVLAQLLGLVSARPAGGGVAR